MFLHIFKKTNAIKTLHNSFRFITSEMKYLNQTEAINVDTELFSTYKYSVDQLMELAGLSCAHAISKCYPLNHENRSKRILFCCGPGNNGGDGLVCARHLAMLGYQCSIYYPKRSTKELFQNLVVQCNSFGDIIRFVDTCPSNNDIQENKYWLIVDALFGFSFQPPIRESFLPIMETLTNASIPIASIDIPSGWHVENGPHTEPNDLNLLSIQPELLISLTAPKLCAKHFQGKFHYLGGRFIPPPLQAKYDLNLIDYPGIETCVEIKKQ